jgi:hypothetical protein
MKKTRFILRFGKLLVAAGAFFLIFCGGNPFSPSTDVGEKIVNDFDPGVMNVQSNLKQFSGSAFIDSSFSMRDRGDSAYWWIQRNTVTMLAGAFNGLSIGTFTAAETAYTYIEFRPDTLRVDGAKRKNLDTAFSIDSVVFMINRFRETVNATASGMAPPASIDAYSCGLLKDSSSIALTTDSIRVSAGKLGTIPAVSLDSVAPDTAYSIKLDTGIFAPRIRRAVKDAGADTSWFAFCLKPSPGSQGVVRFDNSINVPKIIIYSHLSSHDTATTVTTLNRHHATCIMAESDSIAACRHAYSTWETGRRAVLKLNVKTLRDYLDTASGDKRTYQVIQRADLKLNCAGLLSDLHRDSIQVYFTMSDTLARNQYDFMKVAMVTLHRDSSKNAMYTIPVTSWLQMLVSLKRSETVYMYLTAPISLSEYSSPSFIQVDWTQPANRLDLSAIITDPR